MKHTHRAIAIISAFSVVSVFAGWRFVANEELPTLLKQESPYSLDVTISNIKNAVKARNFRMIREQSVAEGILPDTNKQQHIVYFCNFTEAYESLQQDKKIGYMLPCRFTISEVNGKVVISTLNPAALSKLAGAKSGAVCDNNGDSYLDIMEEAVL